MTMRCLLYVVLLSAIGVAQIQEPRVGYVRDRDGNLREVRGLGGSFVIGQAIEAGVIASGFGRTIGYAKKQNELVVFRSGRIADRVEAPSGTARFLMDDAEISAIYFPETSELWRVAKSGFKKENFVPEPEATLSTDRDEVVLPKAIRVRLLETVTAIEWISDRWAVARGESALYAIRVAENSAVLHLPEAAR